MKPLIVVPLGLTVACLVVAQTGAESQGARIVATYKKLTRQTATEAQGAKIVRYVTELETLEGSKGIGVADIPRYVALRAIRAECGVPATPFSKSVDDRIRSAYGLQVRKKWSPEARRLWIEAFYVPGVSSLVEVKEEIAALRSTGVDTNAIEALTIGHGELTPTMPRSARAPKAYSIIERLLKFAEAHPKDIAASYQACGLLDLVSWDAQTSRQPLRKDLLDRVFALEERTIQNMNRLLNDNKPSIKSFDLLRKRIGRGS